MFQTSGGTSRDPMGGQPATPLPFMVVAASEAAVASEANAAAIAASVAAVAGRPDQQGVPNQLSPPAADGTRTVYGVSYSDGIPSCATASFWPRLDQQSWDDPRHSIIPRPLVVSSDRSALRQTRPPPRRA